MKNHLDSAEQDELLRRAAGGDKGSQERLVAAFMPTVVRMATARGEEGLPVGDLVQEGSIGLIEAIQTFPDSGESDFRRFAEARIAAQLTVAIDAEAAAVREAQQLVTACEDYDRVVMVLSRELHREPTEAELAQKLEWTAERTRYVAQVVAEARRRHDEELLQYIDPEAVEVEVDGEPDIDPTLN
ncbi:MAG TPA: sigma factor [Candidatus Dormibacteraeota bacterium]|nr:sigma factor [Candidatus Dormibacteraeota bacterium]